MNSNASVMDFTGAQSLVFGWVDYSLFGSLIGISLLIGIYFGFFSKQNSTSEYLFGGKMMNYLPISASILASFLSGITFLGLPTEVYQHGSIYFGSGVAGILIGLITAYVTMPVLHSLQISTCYEYLELRFSKASKTSASILYIIQLLIYIPIVVFIPALAFSQVTGYSVHAITPLFSIICITYTSMGGVKAVVWTDTIQFVFTLGGIFTILILGIIAAGGIPEIWKISDEAGRIKFFDMNPSLLKRDTFWGMTIGVTLTMFTRLSLGQKFVQRLLAIKNESEMKKAVLLTSFGWALLQVCCVFLGLVMYAYYHNCDPLKAELVDRSDQILPYFVMEVVGDVSGLPGIFLAGLVSSSLSTMSASLNTLSGMVYNIFIEQWIAEGPKKDNQAANIMKVLSVIVGVITIGLVFVIEHLGTVFEIAMGLTTVVEGPILGLFVSGLFLPWIGKKGANIATYTSAIIMAWIVGGAQWHRLNNTLQYPSLPTSVEGCSHLNYTAELKNITELNFDPKDEPMILYRISIVYLSAVGAVIFIIVASITSFITGEANLSNVNPDHIASIVRRFLPLQKVYVGVPLNEVSQLQTNYARKFSDKGEKEIFTNS